ncbi:hypothetical protein CWO89_40870 [Bradyrhizobium sp. Leo170]|nr:hypothetical protein CWO89_40870 [Bradyrhizobium sp. Leo170]
MSGAPRDDNMRQYRVLGIFTQLGIDRTVKLTIIHTVLSEDACRPWLRRNVWIGDRDYSVTKFGRHRVIGDDDSVSVVAKIIGADF